MSDDNKSLLSRLSRDDNKDTIPGRMYFAKSLLNNNKLKSIIDFENTDTENFINKSKDDDSGESYDTRATLKKELHDITNVINNMGGTLQYWKSGTGGHTFKGIEFDKDGKTLYEYAVKVVAYPIKDKYGSMYDTRRPENAELLMIKLLSYFIVKRKTPHIVLPIGTFDTKINNFTNLIEDGFVDKDNEKYNEFITRYNKGEYYDDASILISEWANRGDLSDFIKINYERFTPIHWKVIFFQLISTLAVIQSKFPTFRHNDLKPNNILVTKIGHNIVNFSYKVVGDFYSVPNIGYQIKLWDFDFACIPGIVDNKKVMIANKWSRSINVGVTQNRYYDIHYFFNTLIKRGFFPEIITDQRMPREVKEFIRSIVPPEYQVGNSVSKGGRILHNMEYTTPVDILRTNPYFAEFKVKPKEKQSNIHSNIRSNLKADHKILDFLKVSDTSMRPVSHSNKNSANKINTNCDKREQNAGSLTSKLISSNNVNTIMSGVGRNVEHDTNKIECENKSKTLMKENNNSKIQVRNKVKAKAKAKSKSKSKSKERVKEKSKSKSRSKEKPVSIKTNTIKTNTAKTNTTKTNTAKTNTAKTNIAKTNMIKTNTTKTKANTAKTKTTALKTKENKKISADERDIEEILIGKR